jgi:hypothetical protein
VLSGFGKMLFGKTDETAVTQASHHPVGFNFGTVLANSMMIVLAAAIIVLGFKVPAFIDETIRTCVQVLGAR